MITPVRTGPMLAASRYAQTVCDLVERPATTQANRYHSLAHRAFLLLARECGRPPAAVEARDALAGVYDALGLEAARQWVARAEPSQANAASPQEYLVSDADIYQADQRYDSALDDCTRGQTEAARPQLLQALRAYHQRGGLYQLHVADVLLTLAAVHGEANALDRALRCVADALAIYQRWGRLHEVVCAGLFRIGVLDMLGKPRAAGQQLNETDRLARLVGSEELTVDVACARCALDAGRRPDGKMLSEVRRLAPSYRRTFPARASAHRNCVSRVEAALAQNLAMRKATGLYAKGGPEVSESVRRIVSDHPHAAAAFAGIRFLALPRSSWSRVDANLGVARAALHRAVPNDPVDRLSDRLAASALTLRIWRDPEGAAFDDLASCQPGRCVARSAQLLHADAARQLATFGERWAEAHCDNYRQLRCLGELAAMASAVLARDGDQDAAHVLVGIAADCRPDGVQRSEWHAHKLSAEFCPVTPDALRVVFGPLQEDAR